MLYEVRSRYWERGRFVPLLFRIRYPYIWSFYDLIQSLYKYSIPSNYLEADSFIPAHMNWKIQPDEVLVCIAPYHTV